ncbi:unnamed protein product [Gongylonema pulchrum]|uniref:Snurportin-1 n=1 Tax=Gongylonema pulchrum TaxID=637853 RepID=A0A183DZ35_9BILA|nr:unnamed protein product [Gongylonema pulchrum]
MMANESETADDSYILGTSVTWKWVEKKLQNVFQTKAYFGRKKNAIRIGYGEGYVCVLGRMYLDWVNYSESDKLPETLVIKLPVDQVTEEMQQDTTFRTGSAGWDLQIFSTMMHDFRVKGHANEVIFYKWLQQKDINIENIPHCYIAQDSNQDQSQGLLVIEDMGEEAYASLPFDGLDSEDLSQVLLSFSFLTTDNSSHM